MRKIIALFLFAFFPISLMAAKSSGFKNSGFKELKLDAPERRISIIATDAGYFPDSVFAYVGEKARFFVTSTAEKPQCFLLKDHNVFLAAAKGKLEEGAVEFKYAGRFEFYCPSTNFKGHITVMERPGSDSGKRKVASETVDYWMPRD